MICRRGMLGAIGGSVLIAAGAGRSWAAPGEPLVGQRLQPWTPGTLDIHHLATGRGDATVIVTPNGRVVLIDAGANLDDGPAMSAAAAGASADTGGWIAGYIARRLRETGGDRIESVAITHLHSDHVGAAPRQTAPVQGRGYGPIGVSRVAELVPVGRIVDPCYPTYGYPPLEGSGAIENYIAFVRSFADRGGRVETLRAGSREQLAPALSSPTPFSIRAVAARGRVWTGKGDEARDVFPPRDSLDPKDWPNENAMSAAFRVDFGDFRYFLAGDLTDWADAGTRPWMNALTPAAKAAGKVDVATLPHHGMFDGSSVATIRELAARDWVASTWHAVHPSIETLERVLNERVYPGARSLYATSLHPAADLAMKRLTSRFASTRGNVVCRVEPGGASYRIIVTDPDRDDDRISFISDPRHTRATAA